MSYYIYSEPKLSKMPHTVESTIRLSERDIARGAVDLSMEEEPPVIPNATVYEKAVGLVKEAAPKVIEAIVSHLAPPASSPSPTWVPYQHEPHVFVSPPVETVVVVEIPTNDTVAIPPQTIPPIPATTVSDRVFFYIFIEWLSKFQVQTFFYGKC
jgi:hypothetical protein